MNAWLQEKDDCDDGLKGKLRTTGRVAVGFLYLDLYKFPKLSVWPGLEPAECPEKWNPGGMKGSYLRIIPQFVEERTCNGHMQLLISLAGNYEMI